MSSDELYNVEKILDKRDINGKVEYKIKWEGYPNSQCTWEPMSNLESVKELVEEYEKNHEKKMLGKKRNTKHFRTKKAVIKKAKIANTNDITEKMLTTKVPESTSINDKPQNTEDNKDKEEKTVNSQDNQGIIYSVDTSLKQVSTVKMLNEKLMAVVKKEEDGIEKDVHIPTKELRISNPWILIEFYESKIKFT
jgi:hypothetical protein